MKNNGGSAFPLSAHPEHGYGPAASVEAGMTLRDYFAAKAMGGLIVIADKPDEVADYGVVAFWAYQYADAMLAQRDK